MQKTERDYYREIVRWLEDAYVAAHKRGDKFGGSGSSGDAAHWEARRRVIVEAFDHDGSWLDVGCANGLLMETITTWAMEKGVRLEPHGLDISNRIANTARERLPHWADRIWTGNVMEFEPPIRFDYVTALADAVPIENRSDLVHRIADKYLKPGGRIVISCYGPGVFLFGKPAAAESAANILRAAGFDPIGDALATDAATGMVKVRVAWTDIRR
jgi:SAM-dependent methyltransferase